ncbi:MAG: ERAP1-like C-terminal domain-containing protein, partial [Rubrivivax sp.]
RHAEFDGYATGRRQGGLRAAFESFLNQPGVPIVQVAVDCGGPVPRLRLEQRRFLPAGSTSPPATRPWGIPLCVRWGDTAGTHEQCQLMDRRSATLPLPAAACPAWVMPNAGGAGYYRFTLAPGYAQRLEANFDALDAREQRAYADSVDAAFGAGVLDEAGFLRAAARLATAPERETAMAPLHRLAWIRMHLADTPAAVLELRSFIRATYGPGLDRLGLQPRTDDSDDDRRLRVELMSAVAELGREPALRTMLAAQGRRVLGLRVDGDADVADGQLHPDAAPTDQRALALRVAMEDGDVEVFDALLAHAAASQDAEVRGQLLGAAGAATAPALRARALALALVPGAVRRNEIGVLLDGGWSSSGSAHVEDSAALLQLSRAWLDTHFETVAERVAPYGASLVRRYAAGQCSRAAADTLQAKFAPRVQAIDGGPRALDQAVEQVRLCAALRARLQPAAAQMRAAQRARP